ncbi:MAG: hypothetical protein ACOH2N_07985 [Devosia sp.]
MANQERARSRPTKPAPGALYYAQRPHDEGGGITPTRLAPFGAAKPVCRASLTNVQTFPGICGAMAQLIYDHFNRAG